MSERSRASSGAVVLWVSLGCAGLALTTCCGLMGLFAASDDPQEPAAAVSPPRRGPSPEVWAALPTGGRDIVAMVPTPDGVAAATAEGQLFRVAQDGAVTETELDVGDADLIGLAATTEGLVWASYDAVTRVEGPTLARGDVAALAGDGARAVWVIGDRIAGTEGAPSFAHPSVHVLSSGELAVTPELVAWASHGAREIWVRAEDDGAVSRVAGARGAAELAASGAAILWREPEADLLPGAPSGLLLATRRAGAWTDRRLALEPTSGLTLGDDGVVYGPGRCGAAEADRWLVFGAGDGAPPVVVTAEHVVWTRFAAGAVELLRAPRRACRDAAGNRPPGPRIPE